MGQAGQGSNQNDQFGGFFGMNSGKVKHQKSHKYIIKKP